jgi:hypothetical protein
MTRHDIGICPYCGRLSLVLERVLGATTPTWRIPTHRSVLTSRRETCYGSGRRWEIVA